MTTYLFLLLSLVFALLQGTLLPPVFTEGMLVILFILDKSNSRGFLGIFFAGLIFDLIQSHTLGLSSLIFLLTALVTVVLRNQFFLQKPVYLAIISFLLLIARSKLIYTEVLFLPVGISFLISLLIFSFDRRPAVSQGLRLR